MPTRSARGPFKLKYAFWTLFGLFSLFVLLTRERSLLDAGSFLRQRYAPIPWLMLAHGIPGAIALAAGALQFSSRLRRRFLAVHRIMSRVYAVCVLISAPVAVIVAYRLPTMTLFPAAVIQSLGWMVATAAAIHCVRTGRIQQHREWMMRGYPFAMVFVLTRVILAIPAVQQMGELGVATVVWTVLAAACFLPSFLIAWQAMPPARERAGS
ncbi:DUF2306 domain-containing protein [Candidatus Poribacteria bacterium]|nr:DUF2306 domain-containing protein [Candidatus Poribacteria bacterium]